MEGQTYTVTLNSGFYWCVVTLNGCSSDISNKVWITIVGVSDHTGSASFSIYPVPNNGLFTVMISSLVDEIFTITVYNQIGVKLFGLNNAATVGGKFETQIDLRPIASGMYLVVFMNSEHKVVRKIFVNQ